LLLMTRNPRRLDVATVIVTYRSARLTLDALTSLDAERINPAVRLRAVVVDNASGDLPEIGQAVERAGWTNWVTLVAAPKNGGFAYGNNLGIRTASAEARPDYFYLLNPDAQVRPGAIGTLTDFMETHSDIGIAGSSFENLDGSEWPIAFRFPTLMSEVDFHLRIGLATKLLRRWTVARIMKPVDQATDWICGASMMIRPSVLDAIGGFDEEYFLYFEETDFCYRAKAAGFPTWYVPQGRVMHIAGQSTSVTGEGEGTKRLPGYWFESRRRYFISTYGVGYAIATDVAAIVSYLFGWIKAHAVGESRVPFYLRDLVKHSPIWPRNRTWNPVKVQVFVPPTSVT
jgi:GT2 family glycosyltransferase